MSYVCVKPITLLGNNYKTGELIQDGHILPVQRACAGTHWLHC